MSLVRSIRSAVMRRIADSSLAQRAREQRETARRKAGRPHEVHYFHQVDDPYSQLAAQVLPAFLARYDVRFAPHVVAAPTPVAIHDSALWDAWARRECAAMAPFYDLAFADRGGAPDAALAAQARRVLVRLENSALFAEAAAPLGAALWAGDAAELHKLESAWGAASESEAQARMADSYKLRHRLGHYLGAMFWYEGEWYWGIDRLHYLEARLDSLGARRPKAPAGPSAVLTRRAQPPYAASGRLTLEYFPSLRSPYTHISYERVADLVKRYPVDLVLRPVLPMMMRGVKADRRKGRYILFDTRREADWLGIAFGNIWDPFGDPVRRAYSLFPWARARGRGFEFLHEYSKAVWGERIDAWKLQGLRTIVERAGLPWDEARAKLDNRDWEDEFERNVQDMIAAGSWGVPTLRLPPQRGETDFTVWGQDRIWLIEEEIARRLSAAPG